MQRINKDFSQITIDTDALLIDPPWNYDDNRIEEHQVTYTRWNNDDGLEWIFTQPCKYIFLWVTNSMLIDVMRANHHDFVYKQCITWVKQTNNKNLFYGLGYNFRNCTEQLLVFVRKGQKALHFTERNLIFAPVGKRTIKPKEWESKLVRNLQNKDLSTTYVFSGPNIDKFEEFESMKCVDTCL